MASKPESPAIGIWNLLGRVRSLKLTATTAARRGFFHAAAAAGSVAISRTEGRVMIFHESGVWTSRAWETVDFRNTYQWSLSDPPDTIGLTHLRYGIDNPVHLVDFIAMDPGRMQSLLPHHCGADRYSASLSAADGRIILHWTIRGPAKDDTLRCTYLTG